MTLRKVLSRFGVHATAILFGSIWLIPTLGILITSFRDSAAIAQSGWWTVLPKLFSGGQYSLENYIGVLTQHGFSRSFLNSLLISVPATGISTFIASFAAYGFAWMKFTGRRSLFMMLVALMIIPIQMTLIPVLPLYSKLGLHGTFPGIWLAHTAYGLPLTTYLMHNYMSGIPKDIFDSAAIDGAGLLRTFSKIVIPISVPAIASVFIFQFLWIWNDLLVALVYLGGKDDVIPLTVTLSNMVSDMGRNWELLTAGAFVSMLLPLVVFFALQRYFVRGILAGSLKG